MVQGLPVYVLMYINVQFKTVNFVLDQFRLKNPKKLLQLCVHE